MRAGAHNLAESKFFLVAGLLAPPTWLMRPDVVLRVVSGNLRRPGTPSRPASGVRR
jgi:hypothetical protein